jgi:hypothetical protein
MISQTTVNEVVEQVCRWQRKWEARRGMPNVEELLRWLMKPSGSKSFQQSMRAIYNAYLLAQDLVDEDQLVDVTEPLAKGAKITMVGQGGSGGSGR